MKSYIIGIAGKRNSGKDTVASIINYIFNAGLSASTYSDWIINRNALDIKNKDRIIHFADNLKDIVSIIFNIERELLDDRIYKDKMWYCFNSNSFVLDYDVASYKYKVIEYNDLVEHPLAYYLNNNKIYVTKIRTLLQYIGTDIFKNNIKEDIWIKSCLGKIVDIAYGRTVCIVPDIRYENEANAILRNDKSICGIIIKINRNTGNQDKHSSEQLLNIVPTYTIDNNNNLISLYYKVYNIVQELILNTL